MLDDPTVFGSRRRAREGTPGEVFRVFLLLGLTAFGGPVAHLGYFHAELVRRRRWIGEAGYADLLALCQFLPGPASSQVGFAMGLLRAGPLGALAAFLGFTLPSAILLVAFAYGASVLSGPVGQGVVAGLKIVAVAIVAQATLTLVRNLAPDRTRAAIALGAVILLAAMPGASVQLAAIGLGALAGLALCRDASTATLASSDVGFEPSRRAGLGCLALFAVLLAGLPALAAATGWQGLAVFDGFYRAGALVFGGGHVVLPLLEAELVAPGWVSPDAFLAGYGAAQAVPGPLFTVAAYLGAVLEPRPNGVVGAALACLAIFLPGFLLLLGALPFWALFRRRPAAQALMRGANAAVVGILASALYDPVFTHGVTGPPAFALVLSAFLLLTVWRAPPWLVVIVGALGGVLIGV